MAAMKSTISTTTEDRSILGMKIRYNISIEQQMRSHCAGDATEDPVRAWLDLPHRYGWYCKSTQDLSTTGVEDNKDWRPWVLNRLQWNKGGVPLQGGQSRLVARLEEVEAAEQG
ncbi:hypothetical protein AMS68_007330 [Peltaster fructicola]|uniref:Uncharacterized protein n=1 Tax=Peltaster fructicola TaxID=286661 RepID=A0A6H0Y480_9PEZI|nr:hypothetical protein AMS68_007330 [Peltaster fructicola]